MARSNRSLLQLRDRVLIDLSAFNLSSSNCNTCHGGMLAGFDSPPGIGAKRHCFCLSASITDSVGPKFLGCERGSRPDWAPHTRQQAGNLRIKRITTAQLPLGAHGEHAC
jgi:hypothetical protein